LAELALKYKDLSGELDERSLRLCAAANARMIGRGGVSFVAECLGIKPEHDLRRVC
jgi:hypothetical protein